LAALFNADIRFFFFHFLQTPVNWIKLNKTDEKKLSETLKKIGSAKSKLRALEKSAEQHIF
jgi:hypothetical protein